MSKNTRFAADAAPEAVADAVVRDGYAIVESLATDLTDQLCADLEPHLEAQSFGHTEIMGARTRRVGALIRKSAAAQHLVIHDLVMAVCDQVLLPQCARYQLNYAGCMQLHPGAEQQGLHRDGSLYPLRNPHPPTMVQTMWAGTEFTADNGGTLVVPGSHLWDEDRIPEAHEVVAGEMPRGSVLLYQSGTIHGAGGNNSDGLRTGFAFQYSLGWLRQEENQHLSNPPDVARHYPERLQHLVGYEFGGPYLGFVNGGDPARLLDETPYEGPEMRSRPDIDAAQARVEKMRFGDIDPLA